MHWLQRAVLKVFLYVLVAQGAAQAQELFTEPRDEVNDRTVDDYAVLNLQELLSIEVVTPSVTRHLLEDAPATVHVIPASMIRRRGYQNLHDLLEDIPEFEMPHKNSAENESLFTIRGVTGNEKLIVLLDGVRISSTTGTPHHLGHNYSLANVKQVEIVLGPSSALYGADAFTGVVNLVTFRGDESRGVKLSGSYGQYDTTDDSFVAGGEGGGVSFVVTGSLYHSSEPNFPDAYPDKYSWYNNQYVPNGLVRVSPFAPESVTMNVGTEPYATPTNAHFLNVRLDAGEFELGATRHGTTYSSSLGTLPEFILYVDAARFGYTFQNLYGNHTKRLADNKIELKTSLGFTTYEIDPESAFINNFSGYQKGFKYSRELSTQVEERITYQLHDKVSISGGVAYETFASLPKTSDLTKQYDPNEGTNAQGLIYPGTNIKDGSGRDLTVPLDVYEVNYDNIGVYGELFARPHPALSLTAGGRFDHNSRYGSSLNPRAGVVFSPLPHTRLKLLYGEAFRSPSPYYSYQHFGAFFPAVDSASGNVTGLQSAFWHVPNPELEPEKLRMVEGSLSQRVGALFKASANGYYMKLKDLIVNDVTQNQTFKGWPVDVVEKFVNRGSSTAYGATGRAELIWKNKDFAVNPYAAYTWSNGESQGEGLPFTARHTVKAGLDVGWQKVYLSTRAIARSSSVHPSIRDTDGNRMSTDASVVVNAHLLLADFLAYGPFAASAYLDVRNVLDSRYSYVAADAINVFPDGAPQDPRRFVVGLTLTMRPKNDIRPTSIVTRLGATAAGTP